jgi:hypothetical protein
MMMIDTHAIDVHVEDLTEKLCYQVVKRYRIAQEAQKLSDVLSDKILQKQVLPETRLPFDTEIDEATFWGFQDYLSGDFSSAEFKQAETKLKKICNSAEDECKRLLNMSGSRPREKTVLYCIQLLILNSTHSCATKLAQEWYTMMRNVDKDVE